MKEDVRFSYASEELSAFLSGEIDHHLAKSQREEIDKMLFLKKPKILSLDFSEVNFMDSSGIGLIIGRVEVAGRLSCRVKLTGLSESQRKLIRLSGIEKLENLEIK